MDDLRAVMDAADSERAAVLATFEAGSMAALYSATYPERVAALQAREACTEDHDVLQRTMTIAP